MPLVDLRNLSFQLFLVALDEAAAYNEPCLVVATCLGFDLLQDDVDALVEENGYISGTLNEDGSLTYEMTKLKHNEIMNEMAESIDASLQEIVDSEDYPNIISITHNDNYTEFEVEYGADEIAFADSFVVLTFYYAGGLYGVFDGNRPENIHVTFVNSETGEILQEANSRDMESSTDVDAEESVNDRLLKISNDVTDLWNEVIIEVSSYSERGTSCTGEALDIDFVISTMDTYFDKVIEDKDYIDSLGEEYSDIKESFYKLYDEAMIIYDYLKEETPEANQPLSYAEDIDLFQQYHSYFYEAVNGLD